MCIRDRYALCDWCVLRRHNWHDFCNFALECESSERLLFLLFNVAVFFSFVQAMRGRGRGYRAVWEDAVTTGHARAPYLGPCFRRKGSRKTVAFLFPAKKKNVLCFWLTVIADKIFTDWVSLCSFSFSFSSFFFFFFSLSFCVRLFQLNVWIWLQRNEDVAWPEGV